MPFFIAFALAEEHDRFRREAHSALLVEHNIPCRLGSTRSHVTLKGLFDLHETKVMRIEEVALQLRECVEFFKLGIAPIRLGSVDYFPQGVIYMPVYGGEIQNLFDCLRTDLENNGIHCGEWDGKNPHATLVKEVPAERVRDAVNIISDLHRPQSGILDSISLFEKQGNSPPIEIERISLAA